MKTFFALFISLITIFSTAEAATWEDYKKESDPEKQVQILTQLAWDIKFSQPDSFRLLTDLIIQQSRDINYALGEGNGITYKGVMHYLNDRYDSANFYFDQAIIIFEQHDIKAGLAKLYNYKGLSFDSMDEFSRAIKYYTKSLKLKEESGDKIGTANTLNNIAVMQIDQGNYDDALKNIEKAYTIYLNLENLSGQALALHNIGLVYDNQDDFESAIEYYLQSLHLEEKIGDDSSGMGMSYNNLGSLYADEKRYDEAQYYYAKAQKIYESIGQSSGLSLIYNNLSDAHCEQGNIDKALEFAQYALLIADSTNQPEKVVLAHRNLALAYRKKEQWKDAAKHFERYSHLNDSLLKLSFDAEIEHLTNSLTMTKNYDQMQTAQFKVIQYGNQKVLKQVFLILGVLAILIVFGIHNNWIVMGTKWVSLLIVFGVAALYEAALLFHNELFPESDEITLIYRYGGHILLFVCAVAFITFSTKISKSE